MKWTVSKQFMRGESDFNFLINFLFVTTHWCLRQLNQIRKYPFCVCVTAVLKEWGLQMTSFHLIIAIKTTAKNYKKGVTIKVFIKCKKDKKRSESKL